MNTGIFFKSPNNSETLEGVCVDGARAFFITERLTKTSTEGFCWWKFFARLSPDWPWEEFGNIFCHH